jgi:hypothetical protein
MWQWTPHLSIVCIFRLGFAMPWPAGECQAMCCEQSDPSVGNFRVGRYGPGGRALPGERTRHSEGSEKLWPFMLHRHMNGDILLWYCHRRAECSIQN